MTQGPVLDGLSSEENKMNQYIFSKITFFVLVSFFHVSTPLKMDLIAVPTNKHKERVQL